MNNNLIFSENSRFERRIKGGSREGTGECSPLRKKMIKFLFHIKAYLTAKYQDINNTYEISYYFQTLFNSF